MNRILAHDVDKAKSSVFLQTHATNPFLEVQTIRDALHRFMARDCDSLFTVDRVQERFYDAHRRPINHDSDQLITSLGQ